MPALNRYLPRVTQIEIQVAATTANEARVNTRLPGGTDGTMSPGIPQQQAIEIEDIVNLFRAALVSGVTETGYAHFEVDCSIINRDKDIVRVELMVGTKYSFTVLRRLQLMRGNTRSPGVRTLISGLPQQQAIEMENIVDLFRAALIRGVTETGYAHLEVDCSIINQEKDIVRVGLMVGTKYAITVPRSSLAPTPKWN